MADLRLAIKDRLENGFKNWNGGYDGWLEWCNTLYEPDAHYNVYGHRLTLQQYKDMMGQLFQHYTVLRRGEGAGGVGIIQVKGDGILGHRQSGGGPLIVGIHPTGGGHLQFCPGDAGGVGQPAVLGLGD